MRKTKNIPYYFAKSHFFSTFASEKIRNNSNKNR